MYTVGENVLVQPLWKTVQRFLKKLQMTQQFHSWVYIQTKLNQNTKKIYAPMIISALFIIVRKWRKPKCPSTDQWTLEM